MKMKTKTTKNTYGKGDSCRKDSIGIAVFTDSADGSVHCCHPSISLSDSTLNPGGCSSEADMKRRGFWDKKARTYRFGNRSYNLDSTACRSGDELDMLSLNKCGCPACTERRNRNKADTDAGVEKVCPVCGGTRFMVTAHVTQDWKVDGNGRFIECGNECVEVVHTPNNDDLWICADCGHDGSGSMFMESGAELGGNRG